jgi:hypothetical protein
MMAMEEKLKKYIATLIIVGSLATWLVSGEAGILAMALVILLLGTWLEAPR